MYLDDRGLREQLYRASAVIASSGAHDNRPIMKRILELRRERAGLLGYRTFADLMTEERMARSGENVRQFLATLERKTRPFAQKEHQELEAFRKSLEGPARSAARRLGRQLLLREAPQIPLRSRR